MLAAIKVARQQRLGPDDVLLTVATDGAAMYGTELEHDRRARLPGRLRRRGRGRGLGGAWLAAAGEDHVLEMTRAERDRIFNLGYFTWVEQQGVPLDEFEARRDQAFWTRDPRDRARAGTSSSTSSTTHRGAGADDAR